MPRTGQVQFKFRVLRRYGAACAVCGIEAREVLAAAHLRPKHNRGSDDPRNGLVLCATHHRALDAGLYLIEPDTLAIAPGKGGLSRDELGIAVASVDHLARRPHPQALQWLWDRHSPDGVT